MEITPQEVAGCELIGTKIRIVEATNKSLIGFEGKVIDETRNTIVVESKHKEITLIKEQITMELKYKNKKFRVNGKILVARPEDRLKLKLK